MDKAHSATAATTLYERVKIVVVVVPTKSAEGLRLIKTTFLFFDLYGYLRIQSSLWLVSLLRITNISI